MADEWPVETPDHKLVGTQVQSLVTGVVGKVIKRVEHDASLLIEYTDDAGNRVEAWVEQRHAKAL
jgi:hypothetical protein